MSVLSRHFPPLRWLPHYDIADLKGDLSAGLTVGVMLIPQGMAYALIAGLPPVYGLYAALVPLVVYALFGTSRQLAVGPVAIVSLLVAAGVAPIAGSDPDTYISLALLLTLMVGVIQFLLGLARFGFLVSFLSRPVLSGFSSAAALIIGLSQLKHLLGIDIPHTNYVHEIIWSAIQQAGLIHLPTFLIGIASMVLLVSIKRWKKSMPGPLIVVVLATLSVWLTGLDRYGVDIVGAVPGGLPVPFLPDFNLEYVRALLPTALAISLVGFMESIAVARVFASRNRYDIDPDQELIGLGLANIAGAFFRSYPVTGGFSRTAVNAQAGARSTVASIISAGLIALTLLFLTSQFYYMPRAVLAAIVMVAVASLVEVKEAAYLWRVKRQDFLLLLLTFIATLGLGIEEGILVGVIVSLILVIQQSSRPHTAVMGRLPGQASFRNVERHPDAITQSGVVIFRVDASLYFANIDYVKEKLRKIERNDPSLRVIIMDAYPVNRIDSSAAHALKEIIQEFSDRKIKILFSGVKGPVMDVFERAEITSLVGRNHFFLEIQEAVNEAEKMVNSERTESETVLIY